MVTSTTGLIYDAVRVRLIEIGEAVKAISPELWREYGVVSVELISVDPDRMGGLPTIRDTRTTVGMILGQLAADRDVDGVLEDYPYLDREDVLAAIRYGAAAVNGRLM